MKHEYDVNVYDDGCEYWYKRGTKCLHRLNGPAVTELGGCVYYIDDVRHTEFEYNVRIAVMTMPKEMTVKQIEKKLGYTIKIVK